MVDAAVRIAEPGRRGSARWQQADAALRAELDTLLARQPFLSGPALAAGLWAALARGDTLVVGSSSPIRDLDLAPISAAPPAVFANRGLSGIDGNVSTAVGVAAATERPAHALLGDVTFLHDLTGLIAARREPRPDLRIIVANDNGGSIFATLEPGGQRTPWPTSGSSAPRTPSDFAAAGRRAGGPATRG